MESARATFEGADTGKSGSPTALQENESGLVMKQHAEALAYLKQIFSKGEAEATDAPGVDKVAGLSSDRTDSFSRARAM